ncbi:MAG TPA: Rieske 2Fe-2S domain-containing protein [Dehalococcoidia bacterium]|nr:Rieske 2Fe-2S domain-containing protein [Dehalococcoidia bacterium]
MSDQERENDGDVGQPPPAADEVPVETGDIEKAKEGGLPTPTADQFQEDKPAAEVEPPDKAATAAADSEAGKDGASDSQNAVPDVPTDGQAPTPAIPPASQVAGWQLAGGAARQTVADRRRAERIALAPIREEETRRAALSRRTLLRAGFWTGMGMSIAGVGYCTKENLWPQNVEGFGGIIAVPAGLIPEQGSAPQYFIKGKFWLSNIEPGYGSSAGFGEDSETGGLIALYQKCPHLGCRVPYNEGFTFGDTTGWFRCPCHGSTYNRAGIRVFGPAPRPMDTMLVEVLDDGSIQVDSGTITRGSDDNPNRAVPYNA